MTDKLAEFPINENKKSAFENKKVFFSIYLEIGKSFEENSYFD